MLVKVSWDCWEDEPPGPTRSLLWGNEFGDGTLGHLQLLGRGDTVFSLSTDTSTAAALI